MGKEYEFSTNEPLLPENINLLMQDTQVLNELGDSINDTISTQAIKNCFANTESSVLAFKAELDSQFLNTVEDVSQLQLFANNKIDSLTTSTNNLGVVATSGIAQVNGNLLNSNESVNEEIDRLISAVGDSKAYDSYICDTQSKFNALLRSGTWLGYRTVIFDGINVGDTGFVLSETNNRGIRIPITVKKIIGVNGAKIVVTNFLYDSVSGLGAFWYAQMPTTDDYSIENIIINSDRADCFSNCINLINCSTIMFTEKNYFIYGYRNCKKLYNCKYTSNCSSSSGSEAYGFYDCSQLYKCEAYCNCSKNEGFYRCTNLHECKAVCNNTAQGKNNRGFYQCKQLSNCAVALNNGFAFCYQNCFQLINCVGDVVGFYAGCVFMECFQICNCYGKCAALQGFNYVYNTSKNINGCRVNSSQSAYTSWSGCTKDANSCD